jgi:hypothetical protein
MTGTSILGIALIGLIIGGDIFLMTRKSEYEGTTWSELLREAVSVTTLVPWSLGVWIGHWFPIVQEPVLGKYSWIVVLISTLVIVAVGDVLRIRFRRVVLPPLIPTIAGLFVGGLFLPLRHAY